MSSELDEDQYLAQQKERAERRSAMREQQARDAPKAMAEYHAAAHEVRSKTARLRELRLAQETTGSSSQSSPRKAKAQTRNLGPSR